MMGFDTFALLEDCLAPFAETAAGLRQRAAGSADDAAALAFALAGFRIETEAPWSDLEDAHVRAALATDLTDTSLDWFEEAAEAVRMYSCVVIGRLLGLSRAARADRASLLLARAHLAAFTVTSDARIVAAYSGATTAEDRPSRTATRE